MSAERTVVLLRHGRTAWNHAFRVQGQLDVELDEAGHAEADRVAPVLAALRPSVLWSSDLKRARQTVARVAEATGLEAVYDARLREFDLGDRQGITHEEYRPAHPEEYAAFVRGDFSVVPGSELAADVRARMVDVLTEVRDCLEPGGTAVVVSHGAAARNAVAGLLGWPEGAAGSLRGLANCGWAVLEHGWRGTGWRLQAWNRTVPAPDPSL